jgi:flagellar motor switch protein FliM
MTYRFRFAADELPTEESVKRAYVRHLREVMDNREARSANVMVEQIAFVQPDMFEELEESIEEALGIEPLRRRSLAP